MKSDSDNVTGKEESYTLSNRPAEVEHINFDY